uniref:Uncharacterized protein n=1 Tax=Arundo donax TaxID=35708 RepID=A0A0A9FCZ5_ARUDO
MASRYRLACRTPDTVDASSTAYRRSPSASFQNASADACSVSSNAGPSCATGNTAFRRCPLARTRSSRGSRNGPEGTRYFLLILLVAVPLLPMSRTVNTAAERRQ